MIRRILLSIIVLSISMSCISNATAMVLVSQEMQSGQFIQNQQACPKYGENISPSFEWYDAPQNTASYLLMIEDPDARYPGSATPYKINPHWVAFIPGDMHKLAKNIASQPELAQKLLITQNAAGKNSYLGPCPGDNRTHRYYITLFALSKSIDDYLAIGLDKKMQRDDVFQLVNKDILAVAQGVSLYHKS